MPFAYYARLTPQRQRIYRQSDAIESIGLPPSVEPACDVAAIRAALTAEDRAAAERACQRLTSALTGGYKVPAVRVRVLAQRPSGDYGELHGLYEPGELGESARITVWMRTAQRMQVVAFKSFLRTLVHELCHHLDYELYALEETFHTEGFYKRESSLAHALFGAEGELPGAPADRGAR